MRQFGCGQSPVACSRFVKKGMTKQRQIGLWTVAVDGKSMRKQMQIRLWTVAVDRDCP